MILSKSLVTSREMTFFLYCRKRIRDVYAIRTLLTCEMRALYHYARVLSESGMVFHTARIRALEDAADEIRAKKKEWEAQNDDFALNLFQAMDTISGMTSPEEKASILGNNPQWLDANAPDWRDMDMLDLIFVAMCENEHKIDYELPPMFWYCTRFITKIGKPELAKQIISTLTESPATKTKPKPKLYLVKT